MNQVRKGLEGNTEVREKAEVDWTISSHMDILPIWKDQDFFLRMRRATEGSPPGTEETDLESQPRQRGIKWTKGKQK